MSDQLWGIAGVVIGVVVTLVGTWWNERSKHEREHRTVTRKENRKRCEDLLAAVEEDLASLEAHEERHGVFPVDMGHEFRPSRGRDTLTQVQLNCPPKIHASAVALVEAAEAYGWRGGSLANVESAQNDFIELARKKL